MNPEPSYPEDFPPTAVSLRRDCGGETSLAPGEPDAVLAGDRLYLFGLESGWRSFTLDQLRTVRWRGRNRFKPWRLLAVMLLLLALLALCFFVTLPGLWINVAGVLIVAVSLLLIHLRKETDRVFYRLVVIPELGGQLVLEFPERVTDAAIQRFGLLVLRGIRDDMDREPSRAATDSPLMDDEGDRRLFRRQRR